MLRLAMGASKSHIYVYTHLYNELVDDIRMVQSSEHSGHPFKEFEDWEPFPFFSEKRVFKLVAAFNLGGLSRHHKSS